MAKNKGWTRTHKNGRRAMVLFDHDGFHAGAVPEGQHTGIRGWVPGQLEHAQAQADADSKCPQPCDCPPWREDEGA